MIRKLKSGEYRLYSRKKDLKRENAAIWAHSSHAGKRKPMSVPCSTSNDTISSTSGRDQ
jgi:hypothetical protein